MRRERGLFAFLAPALLVGAAGAVAADPSPHAIDVPPWFAQSFLDFRDEVRDAAAQRKRVMVYFGQDGCPYCKRLFEVNYGQRDIVEATRAHFVAVALNLWGDRETVWLDGKARGEKELGAFLRVQFTPTLLFLGERGEVALRLNGYQPPSRLRLALEYAAQAEPGGPGFAQFSASREAPRPARAEPPRGMFLAAPPALDRAGAGPMLIVFDSRDCETCAELYAALARADIRALSRRFSMHRVDVHEGALARSHGAAFAPTLVFLDAGRREVFRSEGYLRPYHLASALEYVASGAYREEPSFQRYIQARAERDRAAGRPVELW